MRSTTPISVRHDAGAPGVCAGSDEKSPSEKTGVFGWITRTAPVFSCCSNALSQPWRASLAPRASAQRIVDDWARGRLDLTPGITGLWQVLGRPSIPFEGMVKLDYLYVTNWSLWGDVRLILRTLPVVLRRSGVDGHPE
jgi:hypothetical protein